MHKGRTWLLLIGTFLWVGLSGLGCGPSPTPLPPTPAATRAAPTPTAPPTPTTVPETVPIPAPAPTLDPTATPDLGQQILHPGYLSAGDPYAPELGNQGYDVQRYILRLALDPAGPFVGGEVSIEATTTVDELAQLSLDFVGFQIDAVTWVSAEGEEVPVPSFFRDQDKLIVNLPETLAAQTPFTLSIAYHGTPVQIPSPYVPFISHLGLHQQANGGLFVVAEPDGARYWFPANDHPRDKAAFRFELTVPAGLVGVANGLLQEVRTGVEYAFPGGRPGDRYLWQHDAPLAPAFATVAVGDYRRLEGTSPEGIPLRHYLFAEEADAFEEVQPAIGEMIDWMGERFGPYPFDAFGYVLVEGLGASLETQTMVILSARSFQNETTLSHEMAHMWFGDWVSLDSWGEIWRSEGFATYVALMWQFRDDPAAFEEAMAEVNEVVAADYSAYPLNDPPPPQMFGQDSYLKGAALVHALRQEMGDEAFFAGLQAYFERYGGGTASDAQFQAVMEEAAGKSLDALFQTWFSR